MISVCLSIPDATSDAKTLTARSDALPFGDGERERRRAVTRPSALSQTICAWNALYTLTKARGLGDTLSVRRDPNGKPRFESPALPPFSLSHTTALAAAMLGESDGGEVGIDVERIDNVKHPEAVAKRFFSPDEQARFAALGKDANAFCLIWTQKEAAAKQSGVGIAASLQHTAKSEPPFLKSYRLSLGTQTAYLSLAAARPIEAIEFILTSKEISIHELPY